MRLCWIQLRSMASRFCSPPIRSAKCWLPAFLVNPCCGSCWFGWPCSLLSLVSIRRSLPDQWCGARWGKRKGIYSTPFGKKNCFFVEVRGANRCPFVWCHDTSWVTPLTVSWAAEAWGSFLNYHLTSTGTWALNCFVQLHYWTLHMIKAGFLWTGSLTKGIMTWIFDKHSCFVHTMFSKSNVIHTWHIVGVQSIFPEKINLEKQLVYMYVCVCLGRYLLFPLNE